MRRVATYLILIIACAFFPNACSHGLKAPDDPWQQAMRHEGRDISGNVDIVYQAYAIIIDEYLRPVEPGALFDKALDAMQGFVGKEHISIAKEGRNTIVSSSGLSIRVERILDSEQGAKEVANTFSFIVASNPRVDPHDLAYAVIKQMANLDSHSRHMPARGEGMASEKERAQGGVGISMMRAQDGAIITECFEGSPAWKEGVLPGDHLTAVDSTTIKGVSPVETVKLLRGDIGTPVTLTIKREGSPDLLKFTLTRAIITRQNVRHRLLDAHYAYVRIMDLEEGTAFDLDYEMEQVRRESGKSINGVILDLRGNGGGLFSEAIEVSRRFIGSGLIASMEGRISAQNTKFFAGSQVLYPYPMVVLVDKETAMGAELIAGALQDHHVATVVGTPTYKNDSLQTLIPLSDGSSLRITTNEWRLPRTVSINAQGIVPDVLVETGPLRPKDPDRDHCVRAALEILKKARQGPKLSTPL